MNDTLTQTFDEYAFDVLMAQHPTLIVVLNVLIRNGQTPDQIRYYLARSIPSSLTLSMVHSAAVHMQRQREAE